MNIVKLFADLQMNPTKMVYKDIANYYKSCNRTNEAEAFEELLKEKYGHSTPINQKQQQDNSQNT